MKKIVLELQETTYDRLISLSFSKKKSFSELVLELFESDKRAQGFYDDLVQSEFENITREE